MRIKHSELKNFILNESELFLQRHEKRYKDFYLDYNDQVDWINKEVVAKVRAYHNIGLMPTMHKGEVHYYKECTLKRNGLNLHDLASSPDYTTLFIVNSNEEDQLHIEYNDHRNVNKYITYHIKQNMYVTFNSDLNYYFTEHNATNPRIILNLNHQIVL